MLVPAEGVAPAAAPCSASSPPVIQRCPRTEAWAWVTRIPAVPPPGSQIWLAPTISEKDEKASDAGQPNRADE